MECDHIILAWVVLGEETGKSLITNEETRKMKQNKAGKH